MRKNTLKQVWADDKAALGLWLSTGSSIAAEHFGALDFDYINIDMQHGLLDYNEVLYSLQAMQRIGATPTVRVPWNEPGIIGKVLDAGAMGVIIPMVNSVAEAEQAVASCRYAPLGSRSYGPARAGMALGPDYASTANETVLCIPMIETVQAVESIDDILEVPGIDAVYVGPADLSITLGLPPGSDHDDQSFNDALATVVAACNAKGVTPGIHSTHALAAKRIEQGFRMITITSDLLAMVSGASAALKTARGAGDDGTSGRMY
ncbi:MAG: 4-hydroxy-2-oxoheptanedioate aldolase [Acidimicrobiales bacterium]|jgi:4-hydroxy-2-oxoheptanedioate aldolase